MKFRLIGSLILLVVLALAYLVFVDGDSSKPSPGHKDNGAIVLR